MSTQKECKYLKSRDISANVQLYIKDLHIPFSENTFSTFVLSISVYDGDTLLHTNPIISCVTFSSDDTLQSDNWIDLPFRYDEIRLQTRAVITILDYQYKPLYVTCIQFYDQYQFRNGLYKLRCFKTDEHFDVHQLDPEGCLVSNDTLLNIRRKSGISLKIVDSTPLEQIETQEHVQWLDRFTEESLSQMIQLSGNVTKNTNELAVNSTLNSNVLYYPESQYIRDNALQKDQYSIPNLDYFANNYPAYLILRLPCANIPIIYCENKYTTDLYNVNKKSGKSFASKKWATITNVTSGIVSYVNVDEFPLPSKETRDYPFNSSQKSYIYSSPGMTPQLSPPSSVTYSTPLSPISNDSFTEWRSSMNIVYDYFNFNENLITNKYTTLERSAIKHSNANIKPSNEEKKVLTHLIATPTTPEMLTDDQKLLLFKYRYTLIENKKALVKFIYSINWDNEYESSEGRKLLSQWEHIDVDDALILLAKDVQQPFIRKYAISILQDLSDEELDIYLLQLVSAIKWEPGFEKPDDFDVNNESELVHFLFNRASQSLLIGIWLWHYLKAFTRIQTYGSIYEVVFAKYKQFLCPILEEGSEAQTPEPPAQSDIKSEIFKAATQQSEFIEKVLTLGNQINNEGGKANKKCQRLKELLHSENALVIPENLRLPLHPEVIVTGLNIEKSKVFKSARAPFVLEFTVKDPARKDVSEDSFMKNGCAIKECGKSYHACVCKCCANCGIEFSNNEPNKHRHHCRCCNYPICDNCAKDDPKFKIVCKDTNKCELRTMKISQIMFKLGDDIRQDQLVLQMIRLMDKLLKEVSLDLNLSPYRVLPLNDSEGLLEMVQKSVPISHIKVMQEFLKEHNPSNDPPFFVKQEAMSRYIKSFAGYCVITYILGIGDRHLDNIMVKENGALFHIDFGFILGRDPKWNPPKIRITAEMVNGFGGPNSENFKSFINYCCQAYTILRKNANLIYSLLRLMEDSGINDISSDSLNQVVAKFQLDLTEEQAELNFIQIIDNCLKDIWPGILEFAHKIATAAR